MPENPYLELTIAVYRDEETGAHEAFVRMGKQELTSVRGANLGDVLAAAAAGTSRHLTGRTPRQVPEISE